MGDNENPVDALEAAIADLKGLCNTENVYPITNYKDTSSWDAKNNECTFRLLRDMLALAKNGNGEDYSKQKEAWNQKKQVSKNMFVSFLDCVGLGSCLTGVA